MPQRGIIFFFLLFKTFKRLHNSKHSTKPCCISSCLEALQFVKKAVGRCITMCPFLLLHFAIKHGVTRQPTALYFFFFTMAAIFLSIINCCSLRALHQHRQLLFPPETGLVPNLAKCMKPATLKPAQPLSTQAIHTRDENAMLPPPTTSDPLRREREREKKKGKKKTKTKKTSHTTNSHHYR